MRNNTADDFHDAGAAFQRARAILTAGCEHEDLSSPVVARRVFHSHVARVPPSIEVFRHEHAEMLKDNRALIPEAAATTIARCYQRVPY